MMRSTKRTLGLVLILVTAAVLLFRPEIDAQSDSGRVEMVKHPGGKDAYWPRWRGPSGQGVAEGTGYPDHWSDSENVLWRAPVPGRGHSSPIVWADRIFLTTAHDDGRVSVLSYRRSDGELLWEVFGPDETAESLHEKNSHASATPTTDGR